MKMHALILAGTYEPLLKFFLLQEVAMDGSRQLLRTLPLLLLFLLLLVSPAVSYDFWNPATTNVELPSKLTHIHTHAHTHAHTRVHTHTHTHTHSTHSMHLLTHSHIPSPPHTHTHSDHFLIDERHEAIIVTAK